MTLTRIVVWAFAVLYVAGVLVFLKINSLDQEAKRREAYWKRFEGK